MKESIDDIKKEAKEKAKILGKTEEWEDGFVTGWIVKENHDTIIRTILNSDELCKHLNINTIKNKEK